MVINCVPRHFPGLMGMVFQLKLPKKGQKWYTYKLTDLGHKERFKFKTTNIFAFYKTWMYNLDSWFECWLKIFHQFGAMISSKIDPFRPISNISNYLTISPIISPNFQTRSKYLYGSSKGSLKCNKSVNSFLMHIISALKIRKNRKNRPISPPLTVGRTTFWKIKKLGL